MSEPSKEKNLLELLYGISRELASALDLRTVLQRVLYAAITHVGGERASIIVLDDNQKPVEATIVYGGQAHNRKTVQLQDTLDRGLAGWVIQHKQSALIADTSQDERWLRRPDDDEKRTGAKSAISVPLLARQKLVGVLTLVHSKTGAFNEEHLNLMQAIADQAGVAVLNARLYAESQRQARVMTALAESALSINASLRLDEVLQRILEQTNRALQVETMALGLLDANGLVFQRVLGRGTDTLQGKRIQASQGFLAQIIEDGRGLIVQDVRRHKDCLLKENFPGIDIRALAGAPLRARGHTIGLLLAVNPLDEIFDPDTLLVLSGMGGLAGTTIQNVQLFEKLDAAHRRYRELFENSIDPIFITDLQGRIVEANRMAIQAAGYDIDTLHTMSIDQLHEVHWATVGMDFELLNDTTPAKYESTLIRKNGILHVEVHAQRVRFEDEYLLQWLFRDITERRELDALRNDLTSMIYHDLRSPLANIVSSLEVLRATLDLDNNDTASAVLRIADHSVGRIQRLLNSLLDINRLEAGQPIVSQQSISAATLLREAQEAAAPQAAGRQQNIEVKCPEDMPPVWADPDMIRRVLINLMENAIKFSPANTVIEAGARQEGKMALFWVKDHGPGIPETEKERIFDKFQRLNLSKGPKGLGVGLAFCRLAITGHGGKIWVESQPGQGSTFYFTVPLAPPGL